MLADRVRCSVFCGGVSCRYDRWDPWPSSDTAVPGIYSHWITDDVVAMARPGTESMTRFAVVDAFKRMGVRSVINLQRAGEHSACGPKLHECGFSYDPALFMRNDVYYFNYPMKDYGVLSVPFLLDAVKVMAFALRQGKLAVHCHAGLGRTGLLVACHLLFSRRVQGPLEAVDFVRSKRNKSVQTRSQVERVVAFAEFLRPAFAVFPDGGTLTRFLELQGRVLHGREARRLRHVPRAVFAVCRRLSELRGRSLPSSSEKDLQARRTEEEEEEADSRPDFLDSLAAETDARFLELVLVSWFGALETPVSDEERTLLLDGLADEDGRRLLERVLGSGAEARSALLSNF